MSMGEDAGEVGIRTVEGGRVDLSVGRAIIEIPRRRAGRSTSSPKMWTTRTTRPPRLDVCAVVDMDLMKSWANRAFRPSPSMRHQQ